MPIPNRSFSGLADIYAKVYNLAGAALPIGSVSTCEISHDEDTKTQPNYGRAGGNLNSKSRLKKVGIKLTCQSLSKDNLARAIRGTLTAVADAAVVDEAHTAYLGGLIPLANMSPSSVVVKNSAGSTTYVANTDYEVVGMGIVPLAGGAITDGQPIKISYSHPDLEVVEALTDGAKEFTLYFDGLNEAENNNNVSAEFYRVKFNTVKQLPLISEDYVSLALEGEILVDSTKVGAGISKFYRWVQTAQA